MSGKIREKSGNFVVDDLWQPCMSHRNFAALGCLISVFFTDCKYLFRNFDGAI